MKCLFIDINCGKNLLLTKFEPMKKLAILVLVVSSLSCKSSHAQKKINPEALKLGKMVYDSLRKAGNNPKALPYAITMLDKATAIDTNYFSAYQDKFIFQTELKRYSDALITAKHLLVLRPKNVEIKDKVAMAYERAGDSLTAAKYYKSALSTYKEILDTMSVNNPSYKIFKMEEATDLIMLNQQKDGYGLLKQLYNDETDPNYKPMYQQFMNMSRNDMLYGIGAIKGNSIDAIKKK
jgi:tetratricopeptide (TPR) repeat protein